MENFDLLISEAIHEIYSLDFEDLNKSKEVLKEYNECIEGHKLKMIAWDRQ